MRQTRSADRTPAPDPVFGAELRDTERAIRLWNRKASEFGWPPPASAFNLSQMARDSYRFFICADLVVKEDSALILYGATFAKLLGLPERPRLDMPLLSQIPTRYRPLFVEGCDRAIAEAMPVRFNGAVAHGEDIELYRAAFMPLKMLTSTLQFIYGSFSYRPTRDLVMRGGVRLIDRFAAEWALSVLQACGC
jgi:hypothetical protein